MIVSDGVQVNLDNLSAVSNESHLTNFKELQSAVQIFSVCRKFVRNFSAEKYVKWNWGVPQQTAFDELKMCLTFAPVLRHAVVMDHQPLCWLLGLKSSIGRVARWTLQVRTTLACIITWEKLRHFGCPIETTSQKMLRN